MGDKTSIEWSDSTWSPVTGCTRISDGCTNCYIERTPPLRMAHRKFNGHEIGATTGVLLHPERLSVPMRWTKPRKIFVCSMADLFHESVPDEYIARVWGVMRRSPQHTFQVLTKRHARMRNLLSSEEFQEAVFAHGGVSRRSDSYRPYMEHYRTWPARNIWVGVSTENQHWADIRIPALLDTPAAVRFISAEPLLGPITLYPQWMRRDYDRPYGKLDWVIVGGESGNGARPMHPRWAESLQHQCQSAGVPFVFKQWGEWTPMAPVDAQGRFDFRNGVVMTDDGNTYGPGEITYPDGPRWGEALRADFPHHHPTSMYRVGKKKAGRELYHDGRTFDEYPSPAAKEERHV